MDNISKKISAICKNNDRLELMVKKLTEETVARHDISVQDIEHEESLLVNPTDPKHAQHVAQAPRKDAFLFDDFGWVLGFSFAIPVFIGLIIGIFIIGDIRSMTDNVIFGALGGLGGIIVGTLLTRFIKMKHDNKNIAQAKHGGFVIWITVHSDHQVAEVMTILKRYNATNIIVEN